MDPTVSVCVYAFYFILLFFVLLFFVFIVIFVVCRFLLLLRKKGREKKEHEVGRGRKWGRSGKTGWEGKEYD